jgi:hypothetical protein
MATYSKLKLSGSTDWKGIKVTTVGPIDGSDTTIHTAHATAIDLITLEAVNQDTVEHILYLGWGGSTLPDNAITLTIPPLSGFVPIAFDKGLTNSLVVVASAEAANVIMLYGSVKRVA